MIKHMIGQKGKMKVKNDFGTQQICYQCGGDTQLVTAERERPLPRLSMLKLKGIHPEGIWCVFDILHLKLWKGVHSGCCTGWQKHNNATGYRVSCVSGIWGLLPKVSEPCPFKTSPQVKAEIIFRTKYHRSWYHCSMRPRKSLYLSSS